MYEFIFGLIFGTFIGKTVKLQSKKEIGIQAQPIEPFHTPDPISPWTSPIFIPNSKEKYVRGSLKNFWENDES
jgi:hypothetical protein